MMMGKQQSKQQRKQQGKQQEKQQTVLVTGSSRGLGLAIARRFTGTHGVAINNARHPEELRRAALWLQTFAPNVMAVRADVSDPDLAQGLFEAVEAHLGPVDILINNAGVAHYGLFQDMRPEEYQRVMAVNFFAALHCTRLALPHMLRQGRGVIVNISSVWGGRGASCEAVYSASKAALEGFTRALAKELGPAGLRVNAIACGVMDTEMNARWDPAEQAALREQIPLGRFGRPEEAGDLAFFLASDEAEYMNGQVIALDGGM
jgi:3-oxoacyl-[acyl-carrier protein] reductase